MKKLQKSDIGPDQIQGFIEYIFGSGRVIRKGRNLYTGNKFLDPGDSCAISAAGYYDFANPTDRGDLPDLLVVNRKAKNFRDAYYKVCDYFGIENTNCPSARVPVSQKSKMRDPRTLKPSLQSPLYEYIANRRISEAALAYLPVSFIQDKNTIVFPLIDITIEEGEQVAVPVNYKMLVPAGIVEAGSQRKIYSLPQAEVNLPFGYHKLDDSHKPIHIVEGQWDLLALVTCGFQNVLSPFNGTGSGVLWLENVLPELQGHTIYIWPDADAAGHKYAELMSSYLLGKDFDVYYVNMPTNPKTGEAVYKDVNEMLIDQGPLAVTQHFWDNQQNAEPDPIVSASEILSCATNRDQQVFFFLPPSCEMEQRRLMMIPTGGVTVLTGMAGKGKTSLLVWMLSVFALKGGFDGTDPRAAIMSLEMAPHRLVDKLIEVIAEKDESLRLLSILRAADRTPQLTNYMKALTEEWRRICLPYINKCFSFMREADSYPPEAVLAAVDSALKLGIRFICIDNLMSVSVALDDWEGQVQFVRNLRTMALKYDAAILLIAHPPKGIQENGNAASKIAGNSAITNLAEAVLYLELKSMPEGGIETLVHNLKNRYLGSTGTLRYIYEPPGRYLLVDYPLQWKTGWMVPEEERGFYKNLLTESRASSAPGSLGGIMQGLNRYANQYHLLGGAYGHGQDQSTD